MGTAIAAFRETDGQSTPVQHRYPVPFHRPSKEAASIPTVTLSQGLPNLLIPSRTPTKSVTLQDVPTHKDSSEQFRRISRNFEAGEFVLAGKEPVDSDTSDIESGSMESSTDEAEHKVRFIEVPGYGESSAEFRRKSHEFDRKEFAHVKEAPFIRLKKQRSKTTVTKDTREDLMKAVKEERSANLAL